MNRFYLNMALAHPVYGPLYQSVYLASLGLGCYASWVNLVISASEEARKNFGGAKAGE